MNDISNNIKKVMFVFLLCFVALISYITYFYMFKSDTLVLRPDNKRLWAQRNKILRGTIYDRNMKALTKSKKIDELTQHQEYLKGEVFAHALGYMNSTYGLTGLEKKYDKELMGIGNDDFLSLKNSKDKEEKIGNSLRITIDTNVQQQAFDMLEDKKGAVVALDPRTGEVLAMVSKPSYDPNNLEAIWKSLNNNKDIPLLNRAVSGMYPPGSTFKAVTAISALNNIPGVVNKTFEDNGKLVFNSKYSLSNYGGESWGTIDFKNAFKHSSNVVFGKLALELGNSKLKDTAESFYFNKDIPSDSITIDNSRFPTYKSYEEGNIAQSGIGQSEVLSTPMEMALVTSTIANGGEMMQPMLVKEVLTSKGELLRSIEPKSIGRVTSRENAQIMKDLMKSVVQGGTGGNAELEGIDVCGKTGTADHPGTNQGRKAHSWFIGFAPYENPKIAVAVIVEEGGTGGSKAAKIAREVIRTSLNK